MSSINQPSDAGGANVVEGNVANDFAVWDTVTGTYIPKTVAETQAILGVNNTAWGVMLDQDAPSVCSPYQLIAGTLVGTDYSPLSIPYFNFVRPVLVQSVEGEPVVHCELNHSDFTKDIAGDAVAQDGSDGQFMVEFPKAYIRMWRDGTKDYYLLSHEPFPGSSVHPAFVRSGVERDYRYMSMFEGVEASAAGVPVDYATDATADMAVDAKLFSVPGYHPKVLSGRETFRAAALRTGSCFHQQDAWLSDFLAVCMYVYGKTFDTQTFLPGYTDVTTWAQTMIRKTGRAGGARLGSIVADATLDADLVTAGKLSIGDGKAIANSFLWVENIFGHIYKWGDGENWLWTDEPSATVYRCDDPASFADDTATGYTVAADPPLLASGYFLRTIPGTLLPELGGAGTTTGYCDYFYSYAGNAWRAPRLGGNAAIGAIAGVACRSTNLAFADRYSNIGGRLAC